jgi:hypothetical protein
MRKHEKKKSRTIPIKLGEILDIEVPDEKGIVYPYRRHKNRHFCNTDIFSHLNRNLLKTKGVLYPGKRLAHHDLAREFRNASLELSGEKTQNHWDPS